MDSCSLLSKDSDCQTLRLLYLLAESYGGVKIRGYLSMCVQNGLESEMRSARCIIFEGQPAILKSSVALCLEGFTRRMFEPSDPKRGEGSATWLK
jgi:hypothetical protein